MSDKTAAFLNIDFISEISHFSLCTIPIAYSYLEDKIEKWSC